MGYTNAQICTNGHLITTSVEHSSEDTQAFCSQCGSETLTQCPACNAPFRGERLDDDFLSGYEEEKYCYRCGAAYPWTASALEAAEELIKEDDALDEADKEAAIGSLPALLVDGPKTVLATTRVKKVMAKMGAGFADALKDIIVSVISESVKKALWP